MDKELKINVQRSIAASKEVVLGGCVPQMTEVLMKTFETGFESGFSVGYRTAIHASCSILDTMTENRLGDTFMDDFRKMLEEQICEK